VNEDQRTRRERRVLILAPTLRDRDLTQAMLDRAGIACDCFSDLTQLLFSS